jgi:mono/diheme cytochrome c family protein
MLHVDVRWVVTTLAAVTATSMVVGAASPETWKAPVRTNSKVSPLKADATVLKAGKTIFERDCAACHGAKGEGDGPKASDLERSPGELGCEETQAQSDGALFWKISEGRAPMPAMKSLLSETERWQLVTYLRTFGQATETQVQPEFEAAPRVREQVSAILGSYESIRAALRGKGDAKAAAREATLLAKVVDAARSADTASLPQAAATAWDLDLKTMSKGASELTDAGVDLTRQRKAFASLSEAMTQLIRRFGHAEKGDVAAFADAASGFAWLQATTPPESPYGSESAEYKPTVRIAPTKSKP